MFTVPENLGERAYRLLVRLLEEQENVKVDYEVVKKQPEEEKDTA